MVNIWLAHWRAPRLLNYAPGANAIKPSTKEFRAESATKSEAIKVTARSEELAFERRTDKIAGAPD
jgi:hypothetical protein